jgi:hypothetical protein
MLAVHEHFRLDDGDQPGFLAQHGIARQRLRVGLDSAPSGDAVAGHRNVFALRTQLFDVGDFSGRVNFFRLAGFSTLTAIQTAGRNDDRKASHGAFKGRTIDLTPLPS